jgi:hypothetical protein
MKMFVVSACALAIALVTLCSVEAQDKKKLVMKPAEVAKFKLIIKKIDPEIRAAQLSLQTSKKRLQKALNDEVFKEKGPVEGKVIDQLKLALKHVDLAIKEANRAQRLDKGGD